MQSYQIAVSEAKDLAKTLAKQLRGGEVLALTGPLGAGKTAFVKALAQILGVRQAVPSPTFILLQQFPAKLPYRKTPVTLYHLDLYRTKGFAEAKQIGLTEFWQRPDSITTIEWADKIKRHLPKKTIRVNFL